MSFASSASRTAAAFGFVFSPSKKPRPCTPSTGPTTQCARTAALTSRTCASSLSRLITSITVLMAAHATGPPPNVVPSAPAFSERAISCGISTAPHGKPPPKPFATVSKSGPNAVQLRAKRLAEPAHAGLHLVDDQQRAGAVARRARGVHELGREIERARETLHGLDDHARGRGVDGRVQRGDVVARRRTARRTGCAETRTTIAARPT